MEKELLNNPVILRCSLDRQKITRWPYSGNIIICAAPKAAECLLRGQLAPEGGERERLRAIVQAWSSGCGSTASVRLLPNGLAGLVREVRGTRRVAA